MENATKALMIAGAVLLAILVIGIGMTIFRTTSDLVNTDKIGQEISTGQFNSQFTTYEGKSKTGSDCRALIDIVISNNNYYTEQDDTARVVKVTADKDQEKTATADLEKIKKAIVPGSRYTVEVHKDSTTGYVDLITITKREATPAE